MHSVRSSKGIRIRQRRGFARKRVVELDDSQLTPTLIEGSVGRTRPGSSQPTLARRARERRASLHVGKARRGDRRSAGKDLE